MRIVRDFKELIAPPPQAVVTIGNFDGVHLGHREIFRRVVARARSLQGTAVVLTFVPHPLKFLAPERAPRLINTDAEKERLIAASCIDLLICAPFTRELAACSAEDFVCEYLVGRIGVRHLIVGYDYAFGRGREGDSAFLRRQGELYGFTVEVLDPITRQEGVFSSTRVRELLLQGEMEAVVGLLGRHFTLEGQVVRGAGRGRSLGFPTANLQTEKDILPRPGVYAVKVKRGETIYDGVLNIGSNPTFGGRGMSVEVHLLDFSGDLYDEQLRLYFVRRLRDEECFAAVEALRAAITADVVAARQLLATTRIIEYREYLDCGNAAVSGGCP
ncbi:MAG: riboflavin biosynthesis protein RibF [Desulfuromonadales bacterium GWC2_61_20]|nr:MAG: riboflavin biosynthesis protein RibF [Desulfuromonadales bacterium GWC2_61_20]HAD04356.1 riboflavin biosynthesis protein RibF [Desulfuromonas sp.]HBT83518.1 riboflavin biosynthesis protein RibF [Desulfuromonas sp.]